MKKIIKLLTITFIAFFLVACANQAKEEKTYDAEFISSLAKGLENRWKAIDSDEKEGVNTDTAPNLTKYIQLELDQIEKYQDLKFKDNKLKEIAISYINELKNGIEIAQTFGAQSAYENFTKHQQNRTEKLNQINNISEITVSETYQEIFNELLAAGKEVETNQTNKETTESFVGSLNFVLDEANSSEWGSTYKTTVENTTGLNYESLSINVKLIDDQGVTVDTPMIFIDNFTNGEKRELEFYTSKQFTKIELALDYFNLK